MRRIAFALAVLLAVTGLAAGAPAQEETPPEDAEKVRIQIDLDRILEQARAAFRDGRLEEAIALYQVILRFAPDSRVARIELSFALVALGERERAAKLLRDLDTEGLDPELAAAIGKIVGPDRFIFFAIPEFFLDSNINGQTNEQTVLIGGLPFTLSSDAQGRTGYGYGLTVGGAYRLPGESPGVTLTFGARLRDFEQSRDDEVRLFSSAGLRFDAGKVDILPTLSAAYRFRDGAPYEAEFGVGLAAAMDVRRVRNTLGIQYREAVGQGDFDDTLDRRIYELSDTVSVGLGSIALKFDGRGFAENWLARDDQDNTGFRTGVDVTLVKMPWVIPTVGGGFTYRDFNNPALLFAVERLDRVYDGHLELLLREWDIFGSKPFIRYQYTHATSNIGLFDYDRNEVTVGVRAITW